MENFNDHVILTILCDEALCITSPLIFQAIYWSMISSIGIPTPFHGRMRYRSKANRQPSTLQTATVRKMRDNLSEVVL